MDIIHAVIISIVEGITEFLPISSTGHMILTFDLLGIPETDFTKSFEIIIQLGAILAVVFLYLKKLVRERGIWKNIIIAFLPTGITGILFYKIVKKYLLGNPQVVLVSLAIGGLLLILLEMKFRKRADSGKNISEIRSTDALRIGLFQSVSMIPGVSRSAATIFGGLISGLSRDQAVEFSFFLAIPTMLAATGLDLMKSAGSFSTSEVYLILAGFIGAFVTAMLAVKFFIGYVRKHTFIPFGIYRILLAVIFWLFILR